jgi:hypothetical protein
VSWQDSGDYIISYAGEMEREGRFMKMLQIKVHKNDIDKLEQDYFDAIKTELFIGGLVSLIIVIAGLAWDGPNVRLK